MSGDKQRQLVVKAIQLYHANQMIFVMSEGEIPSEWRFEPKYAALGANRLKREICELEELFSTNAKTVFSELKKSNMAAAVRWLDEIHVAWIISGCGLYDLGRVHEFEARFGRFGYRDVKDCPPYAQLLLQGYGGGMAVRHPEYHLATDLALLYNLFLDSQRVAATAEPEQSLGRSVILTCYNLLESFTSGLAEAYLLENPNASADRKKKLKNNDAPLSKRLRVFTFLVKGTDGSFSKDEKPFDRLFGECKERRDSFVHCEPGPEPSKRGYIKEVHFNDITPANVKEVVDLTEEAICLAWKHVDGKDRPSWLQCRDNDGRFPRIAVSLTERKEKS